MPRKVLITPDPNNRLSPQPYYIDVYDFSVVVPRPCGIEFLSADGPLPEDAAAYVIDKLSPDVKEVFLASRTERGVLPDYWRVRVEAGKVVSVEKTEKTFDEYDRMQARALKEELAQLKKVERAPRKRK